MASIHKFEYKTIVTESPLKSGRAFEIILNQHGADGWELFHCYPTTMGRETAVIIFKRLLADEEKDENRAQAGRRAREAQPV